MNELDKIGKLVKITKFALDRYVDYQNAKINKYQNIHHIMNEESEIQIPSSKESYSFDRDIWNISEVDKYIILTKKK